MSKKILFHVSQEEAIRRLENSLGTEKYDFSQVKYTGNKNKVNIFCKLHKIEFAIRIVLAWKGCTACRECQRIKLKKTNNERYGTDYVYQNEDIIQKIQNTTEERYGVRHILQNPLSIQKKNETTITRYGTDNIRTVAEYENKRINTLINKYGVDHIFKSDHFKQQSQKTFFKKYGVKHPMHNSEFLKSRQKKAFKLKEFILPSGKIIYIQGYEPQVLSYILENKIYYENDFQFENVPVISYDNGKRKYHPDFFIPEFNKIIEVKSWWTYKNGLKTNLQKKHACLQEGYKFNFYIWDDNQLIIL